MASCGYRYLIGIPTVRRQRDYLGETIASILGVMEPQPAPTAVVIYNADPVPESHAQVSAVAERYAPWIESGRLRVLPREARADSLPPADQASWREKQVLDCATLLEHCSGHCDYYLHLEDDVIAAPGFLTAIEGRRKDHETSRRKWAILSFYNSHQVQDGACYTEYRITRRYFGFIGQLFHGSSLPSLCSYLRKNANAAPVDLLVGRWALSIGGNIIAHAPALFQHVGVISSFQGQVQPWDTPQFPEAESVRRLRMQAAVRDIKVHSVDTAMDFLRYRRLLLAARRL